jgi:hypothetical protein
MSDRHQISTEGRVFIAQLTRELAAKQILGAGLLHPGATTWRDAVKGFCEISIKQKGCGPRQAAVAVQQMIDRLYEAHRKQAGCFVNAHHVGRRSAGVEFMVWQVAPHPLTKTGNDGVLLECFTLVSRRSARIEGRGGPTAYVPWHALGRMRERSPNTDLLAARGVAGICGLAGLLLRESTKHDGTEINIAAEDEGLLITGVMRVSERYAYYDAHTCLPMPEHCTPAVAQGRAILKAVAKYVKSDDADPRGYADDIPVIPHRGDDYITRMLTANAGLCLPG